MTIIWPTRLTSVSETLLFIIKLFIINSNTTKCSLLFYTLINHLTSNINFKSTSKNTQNTINQYQLWLSYLCWMKMVAKWFGIYIFLGVELTHFLKITKKFTIIVIHVRKITLCTVVKRLLPYLEFWSKLLKIIKNLIGWCKITPYLTEKHFLL